MKLLNKVFFKISPRIREKFFYFNFFKNPIKKIIDLQKLKEIYKNKRNELEDYSSDTKKVYKSLKKIVIETPDGIEFAKKYYEDKINIIKKVNLHKDKIILICLIKDDLRRVKEFYNHYKELGVKNFIFIDNNSTDGTFELLQNLDDVFLFRVKEKYTTIRRQAWITKIMTYFGYNNWYLIVDSDEFLVYNDCEKRNIDELINKMKSEKKYRLKALMIDMYADGKFLGIEDNSDESIQKKYCYFDNDSYNEEKHKKFELVTGGMRKRVFGKYGNISPFLIKYPIIYFEEGELQYNSHFSYPFYKNFNKELNLALLDYKFLSEDLKKIKTRVNEKNYASGSKEYNAYLRAYHEDKNINLKNENSVKYINSDSLKKINLITSIIW